MNIKKDSLSLEGLLTTSEKAVHDAPAATPAPGEFYVCSVEDRAALVDLYRCVYPRASLEEIAQYTKAEEASAWMAYRSAAGELRVALFVRSDGCVLVLAKPEECESSEVIDGFLRLAVEARSVLQRHGVSELTLVHASGLKLLGKSLEQAGWVSKEAAIVRMVYFEENGKIARAI